MFGNFGELLDLHASHRIYGADATEEEEGIEEEEVSARHRRAMVVGSMLHAVWQMVLVELDYIVQAKPCQARFFINQEACQDACILKPAFSVCWRPIFPHHLHTHVQQ